MFRRELHFSVSQGDEKVDQQTYTKTWQVDGGQLLRGDGGAVDKLTPIGRGTTAEIEARHAQLDDILVGLLSEATANKGQAPTSGSVTLTSQRVAKSQPQVKKYTETSTLLKTEQRQKQLEQASSSTTDKQPKRDDVIVNGRQEPTYRPAVSDTEEPRSIVREYVFLRSFKSKNVIFLRFFEVAFKRKRKKVIQKFQVSEYIQHCITRKLCCRKDDRAMRPMGALNFRDSLTMPTATIPNIFMVFCSDQAYECSYKI